MLVAGSPLLSRPTTASAQSWPNNKITLNVGGEVVNVRYGDYGASNYKHSEELTATPKGCDDCMWAQVVSRTGDGAESPKKDGGGYGPLYGAEQGPRNQLYDTPASNGPGTFRATSLLGSVSIKDKTFIAKGGISWGYTGDKSGGTRFMVPRLATSSETSMALKVLKSNAQDWNIR